MFRFLENGNVGKLQNFTKISHFLSKFTSFLPKSPFFLAKLYYFLEELGKNEGKWGKMCQNWRFFFKNVPKSLVFLRFFTYFFGFSLQMCENCGKLVFFRPKWIFPRVYKKQFISRSRVFCYWGLGYYS